MRPTPQYQTVLTIHFIIRGITPFAHFLTKCNNGNSVTLAIFIFMNFDICKNIRVTVTNIRQVAALLEIFFC